MADGTAITQYQYYGLIGKGMTEIQGIATQGITQSMQFAIESGGYNMSAEAFDIQAEQELINGEMQANARMDQYNNIAATNNVMKAAMGGTNENDTIDMANLDAAEKDASLMRRSGRMKNISARAQASGARSASRSKKIAMKASQTQALIGAVGSVASSVGAYSMFTTGKTTTASGEVDAVSTASPAAKSTPTPARVVSYKNVGNKNEVYLPTPKPLGY